MNTVARTVRPPGAERVGPIDRRHYEELFAAAAERAGGVTDRHFLVAGDAVTLRFAGEELLADVCTALSHLEVRQLWRSPDLLVHVWDGASTGGGDLLSDPGGAWTTSGGPWTIERVDGLQVGHRADGTFLSGLDSSDGIAWHWVRGRAHLQEWDRAAPLRALLHWWFSRRGVHLLHGGAVGVAGSGVLLVGAGGSGKSTATLACTRYGMHYAGDDFVAASPGAPPVVHSIYCSAKLEPHHLQRFPQLLPDAAMQIDLDRAPEKVVAYLDRLYPDQMAAGFRLAAMVVPQVGHGAASRVEPVSRAEILHALAPSSLFLLPGAARQETLTALGAIVAAVPAYRLHMGHDLDGIAAAVLELSTEVTHVDA